MQRTRRIAVVGGGIAGMGAAWALARGGARVTVYEARPTLGGNAKTHTWRTERGDVVTGLSVLAWPDAYFRNYGCLIEALGIATEPAPPLRYFLADEDGGNVWAHGLDTPLARKLAPDLDRWDALVARVRALNGRLGDAGSLYDVRWYHPLNALPLRRLCTLFGISRAFWEQVFVPIQSASFLTADLDALPAVIAPALDDIVSLRHGGALRTWSGSSRTVFERLSEPLEALHTEAPPRRVWRRADGVEIEGADGARAAFDALVLACPAPDALTMLAEPSGPERLLLGNVRYGDDGDDTFLRGQIHSDASVLPPAHRAAILGGYANYVERSQRGGRLACDHTFVLSSWIPAVRGGDLPMLVSYGRPRAVAAVGEVSNRRAHPRFTPQNLAIALLLHRLQGRRNTYYCGAHTTPGNGHDLSLLSGLVVADALGAPYPFAHDAAARRDFTYLRRLMLRGSRATA